MSLAQEIRADLLTLINEVGFGAQMFSQVPSGSGPAASLVTSMLNVRMVRQNNVRRFSPWASEDGDALVTMAVGDPPQGIKTMPSKGFYFRFLEIWPGDDPSTQTAGERWNVVQSRDRVVDGEIVAFTMLVRR